MVSLILPMQLPIVALSKGGWKPFCSCPFDEAVPGSLRCEIMPVFDLWAVLDVINILEAPSLGALYPPTLPLTTALQPIVNVGMSLWDNQWLMVFHSFQRDVYLNSALTHWINMSLAAFLMCENHVKGVPAHHLHPCRPETLLHELHENRQLQINAPPMSYLCQLLTMNGLDTVKARCINLRRLLLSWLILPIDLPPMIQLWWATDHRS